LSINSQHPVLSIKDLNVSYDTLEGKVQAVSDVSFDIRHRDFVGLSGESGCGKSTVANTIMHILPKEGVVENGAIIFQGQDTLSFTAEEKRRYRWRDVSMIFQSSMNALNPVHRVINQMVDTILIHETVTKKEAEERSLDLMEAMGLERSRGKAYPHELSGGMRQRMMIALALATHPPLVIADEPTTALDVMVQAQILELLKKLREEVDLSLLLITHDLSVIAETCDKIIIMYAGRIMEEATVKRLFTQPAHPYTQKLISSFPSVLEDKPIDYIPGNPPNLISPPQGCPFHPRCDYVTKRCRQELPPLQQKKEGYRVACWRVDEI
jgi:peptide/nickel transport system ATP-binding protein